MHHALSTQRAKVRARHRALPLQLTAADVVPEPYAEAPFEPPPLDDIFGLSECEDEEPLMVAEEEDAPFDPPEFEDEPVFTAPPIVEAAPVIVIEPPKPAAPPAAAKPKDRPLPAISIYASWDRPEVETLMQLLASDPRLARADIEIARGGLDRAVAHGGADLFLIDTTLDAPSMLASLDRLREAAPVACIVILGTVNDIALLRDLAARGVSDYIVPPAKAEDVARSLCALFAGVDTARTIAVIGARGGIGASTIARNVAWSIAERQQQKTTLVDLDLSFGMAAQSFDHKALLSVSDVVGADDAEEALSQALCKPTPHLNLLAAPAKTESLEIDPGAFDTLMSNIRRTASYVVLDLPHAWEPWVRMALREADEVLIVAGPDLASLRNADNMLKLLRSERDRPSAPTIVISMSGLPKRPEIPLKDFSDALRASPALTFAFEPELFAAAEADGQMIYELMPDAKAALQLDLLASMLTGRDPVAVPAARAKPKAAAEPAPQPQPVLDLVTPAPPPRRSRRQHKIARTGYIALQEPPPGKRPARGLVRTLAAVVALTVAGVWIVGHRSDEAPANWPSAFSA